MARATGIGGVFFKAKDPVGLAAWYREHLGLAVGEGENYARLTWSDDPQPDGGNTIWSAFPEDTDYFGGDQSFMFNLRVDDLDRVLAKLREAGVKVDDKVDDFDFGRFGWFTDPEGNRVELWEPRMPSG
ncbi:MAG TPA: VOC family protein [Dehalococcoidia bacterium]|nr:VOC family protein [Dehalococcoidia bacterium]